MLRDVDRDGRLDVVHKIRLVDRSKYIEMAAKHFSLLVENLKVTGGLSSVDEHASDEELSRFARGILERARARMEVE